MYPLDRIARLTVVAALATGAAGACVKARTDPITGRVAMDVRSPLRKGDIWTAKVSGEGSRAAANGEARAEVYQGRTTASVWLAGLTPGDTHPWRLYQGRCGEEGGPIGEADAYPPLVVGEGGTTQGTAQLPLELGITRKYKIRVFASRMDPTTSVACGDLSDRCPMSGER